MMIFIGVLFLVVLAEVWYINKLLERIRELEDTPLDNRARDAQGKYVKDNPATSKNEAYKKRK